MHHRDWRLAKRSENRPDLSINLRFRGAAFPLHPCHARSECRPWTLHFLTNKSRFSTWPMVSASPKSHRMLAIGRSQARSPVTSGPSSPNWGSVDSTSPESDGGTGLSRLDATLVFEALSMACPSVAAFLSIHNMCAKMIATHGSDDLKSRLLPGALAMEVVFSYCLTEPGSGSDAAALKTRADRTNQGWRLNGVKSFISGGGYSDAYIVMARTGRRRAEGHFGAGGRRRLSRPVVRQAGGQDGLAVAADPRGPVGRLRCIHRGIAR